MQVTTSEAPNKGDYSVDGKYSLGVVTLGLCSDLCGDYRRAL